jgi:Dyp-type peroxidase family
LGGGTGGGGASGCIHVAGQQGALRLPSRISQPCIENDNPPDERLGALALGPPENTVAAGEFLYGYLDTLKELPLSPQVPAELDPDGILGPADAVQHDFGRNGTYLVARQLAQEVHRFWDFVFAKSREAGEDPIRLAAKMVGRWPNGTPLVSAPERPADDFEERAYFGFRAEDDTAGYKCPLGAHIRRANPRDTLVEDAEKSFEIVKRHRLIRRGRPYGEPLDRSMEPARMLDAPRGGERGLLFLAFNVHLARQFEFVQQNWINNPKFAQLDTDVDPILGQIRAESTFTVQREPVRLRIKGLTSFVTVRGSGYFFMPGLTALRYLASRRPLAGVVPTAAPARRSGPRRVTGSARA